MERFKSDKWNRACAAHLLVRSGFGATPQQIEAAASQSLDATVRSLFQTPTSPEPPAWLTPESKTKPNLRAYRALDEKEKQEARQERQREARRQMGELTGWWLDQMINTPCPLQEKMTLFWHGHFATSVRKVRAPYMMYMQNETFRKNAFGSWQELITAVAQDPAMLNYLDNERSKAGAPNENFARELMELFTLGEGYYTEDDIRSAARAFTGWTTARASYTFQFNERMHDRGTKTFFKKSGNYDGHDIIRIILKKDQAARFIAAKLWAWFAYQEPEDELVDHLAGVLREHDYDLKPLLETIFLSKAFYSEKAMRTQIKSPVQWLTGTCISLSIDQPDPRASINALRTLGQELFAPPNVKGWDGGIAWITTASLTSRNNMAQDLITRRKRPGMGMDRDRRRQRGAYVVDTNNVLPPDQRSDLQNVRKYLETRLYQTRLSAAEQKKLDPVFSDLKPVSEWRDSDVRDILQKMMVAPHYQLT